jgi:hypothetical protein
MNGLDHFLSVTNRRTLAAVADRIIPVDDFPSASESGALEFLFGLLNRELPHRWPELISGLERIDALAHATHGSAYCDLPADLQDETLDKIDRGLRLEDRAFFRWLVDLITEGYYADPANGGNRRAASWSMVGYDPRVPGYSPFTDDLRTNDDGR